MRYEAWGFRKNGGASAKIEKARFYEIKAAKTVCLFAVDLEEKLKQMLRELSQDTDQDVKYYAQRNLQNYF